MDIDRDVKDLRHFRYGNRDMKTGKIGFSRHNLLGESASTENIVVEGF